MFAWRRVAGVALSLGFLPGHFAWAFTDNFLSSATRVGPGIITQSLQFSHQLVRMDVSESEGARIKRFYRDFHPLSAHLGVDFMRNESEKTAFDPAILDYFLGFKAGLDWEISPRLQSGFRLQIDGSMEEVYGHGAVLFHVDYTLPIRKTKVIEKELDPDEVPDSKKDASEKDDEGYDPEDARQYYERIGQVDLKKWTAARRADAGSEEEGEADPSDEGDFERWERFHRVKIPYIKFVGHMGFSHHLTQTKTYRRTSLSNASISGGASNQYQVGAEAIYISLKQLEARAGVFFYIYSSPVDPFINLIEQDTLRRQPLSARPGLNLAENQLLAFPRWTIHQSIQWTASPRYNFRLEVAEFVFASVSQPFAVAVSPVFSNILGRDWTLDFGALLTASSIAGTYSGFFTLNWKLTQ